MNAVARTWSWLAALACTLFLAACGSADPPGSPAQARAGDGAAPTPSPAAASAGTPPAGASLRLSLHHVQDPMAGGIDAVRFLLPRGWSVDGGVRWQMEYSNLATVAVRIQDPATGAAIEGLPIRPFVWDTQGIAFFGPGSIYLGNEVRAPARDVESFVREVVVPQCRAGCTGLRVTGRADLPAVARAVAASAQEPGVQKDVKAGRVRLEYTAGGQEFEEDVYCVLVYSRSPLLPTATYWGPDRLYGFRAPKGRLDEVSPLLQTIVASVQVDLDWFAQYMQVVQMWRNNQMQAIRNAGEISRYISKTSDEIRQMYRSAWESQQAATDRVYQSFSETIRGVETWNDPWKSHPVELPTGYAEAWVSNRGEYVLSNDAGFDPNVTTGEQWKRLEKR